MQRLLGTMDKFDSARGRLSEVSERLVRSAGLQADFLAGVWAHYAQQKGLREEGDIEEALGAASAVGDDRLSGKSGLRRSRLVHSWHLRATIRWFRKGLETGDVRQGDTFNGGVCKKNQRITDHLIFTPFHLVIDLIDMGTL